MPSAEFPDLQQYAGQTRMTPGGVTRANPDDEKLAGQVATLFKGETLRGLLLYAWGWSVVSTIAFYAGIAALLGFLIMLLVTLGDFFADPKIAAHHVAAEAV
jgi:hypothetical protein